MIPLKSLLSEDLKKISLQQAQDNRFFGPVYHGTSQENREKIAMDGFRIRIGHERSGDVTNGFEVSDYSGGIPAPIHFLGFGVYFTTVRAIAKKFSGGTGRGITPFFLDVPGLETINFGSTSNMMKWWMANGYDYKVTPETTFGGMRTDWGGTKNTLPAIREERLRATKNMTQHLSTRYDAVWYKGKGMFKLLDGDQVCVYDPSNIYLMDKSLIQPGEIGSVVVAKRRIAHLNYAGEEYRVIEAGDKGIILGKEDITSKREQYPKYWAERAIKYVIDVKFKNAGTQQVEDVDVEPYTKK